MLEREPLLDIVLLHHNQSKWADLAIRAVEHQTKNPYRLIVVDNASTDSDSKALLKDVEERGHTVIHLAENRSFSNGVNVGVRAGSAKFVVILNDDAIVTEGWDSALLQDASDKNVGLVGARSNQAAGHQGNPAAVGEPPYLVFVCVALRRQMWDLIGPMDEETFDGFSTEDIDYSWRVKKAGYQLKLSNAYVLHAGSRTLMATQGDVERRTRNDRKYNERLIEKWGKEWAISHSKGQEKVLVTSFHAEEWTRVSFLGSFVGLKRSDGYNFQFYNQTRAPIHHARQAVADYALDSGFDVLVSLDDDAVFPADIIKRFLAHQKDVVCALAYQRKTPYGTCAFEVGEDGLLGRPLEGIEHTGLRKVDVSGFHCSAVRTSVFKKLREVGIKQYYGGFDNKVGEDFAMCLNLKKVGIPVYLDTELIAGHLGSSILVDEQWKKDYLAGKVK